MNPYVFSDDLLVPVAVGQARAPGTSDPVKYVPKRYPSSGLYIFFSPHIFDAMSSKEDTGKKLSNIGVFMQGFFLP